MCYSTSCVRFVCYVYRNNSSNVCLQCSGKSGGRMRTRGTTRAADSCWMYRSTKTHQYKNRSLGVKGSISLCTLVLHLLWFCSGFWCSEPVPSPSFPLKEDVQSSWPSPRRGLISAHILPLLSHANELTKSLLLFRKMHALPSTL